MTPASLQARAGLALALLVTLLWLGAAAVTARILNAEMEEVFDAALQETGQRILQLAVIDILNREDEGTLQRVTALNEHEEFFTYLVRDDQGRVLLTSHAANPAAFPAYDGPGFRRTATHRLYQEAAVQGTVTIAVAEPLSHRADVAGEVRLGLAVPLALLIPLSLLGIGLSVRVSLRPLGRLRDQVAARDAGDLAPVPAEALPSELRPIVTTMNQLFARLTEAFAAERNFASNAAHELRTPLAGAIAQAQRLQQETRDPDASRRAADIEATLKRLTRLAERLMQLARAEGARLRGDTTTDLRGLLRMVAGDRARDVAAGQLRLSLPDAPVLSDIDPDVFAILCGNLIENAVRHGNGGPVSISLSERGVFCVENDCPPIAPEALASLTDRFTRAPSTGAGSGLGLAIVRTLTDRLGGRLSLTSPVPGTDRGFRACVTLSPAPPVRAAD